MFNMTMVEVESEEDKIRIPTMGIDENWVCYINPDFYETLDIKHAAHIFIHENYHLISDHPGRAKAILDLNPIQWNIAADIAINDDIIANGWDLPDDCQTSQKWGFPQGLLAEEYYKLLADHPDLPPEDQYFLEGSGATGKKEDWEGEGKGGKGKDIKKVSAQRGKIIRQQVAKDISNTQGNVPGNLKRWAEDHLNPQIDWRTKLASAVRGVIATAAGMVDFSYKRPSRRSACYGNIIMPRMVAPVPDVSVLLDTSGSMGDEDMSSGLGEVKGILATLGTPIKVYTADTQVNTNQNVFDPSDIEMIGGGGTDMSGAIYEVAKDNRCSLLVVITDGYTGWPTRKPDEIDNIVAVITRPGQETSVPDWIDTVVINETKRSR